MSKLAPIDRACSHHCPLPNPRVQYKQPSPQSLLPAGWPSDRRPMLPSFITSPAVLLEHSETVIATPRHVRDERCEARHQPEEIRTKLKQRKDNSLRSVRTELCFTPQARPSWTCEVLSTRRRKYLYISNGAPRRRHGVNEYLSPMALQTVVVHAGPTRNNLTSIFWLDGWTVNSNFTTPHSHSLTHPRPGRPRAAQRRLFLLCTHVDFLVLGRPPSLEKSVQTPDRLSATTPRPRHRRTCRARQPSTHPTNHPAPPFRHLKQAYTHTYDTKPLASSPSIIAYKNLSPKTRLAVGVGVIAWGVAGLYLSDRAEEKFGYTPSDKDKEELRSWTPRIVTVEKPDRGDK
ncbi:hypothetical protein VFPBJ_00901 [Purpureocillium lilacinum]|uniref:Uncharacterized protein n=1 Tax=Purpureocillium lilacinum TaxID=33203 RepID=A0A179HBH1_PURLI|nr:hypothetical protein VFPBJ_00901 [Purpureocillium lilacinum]